MLPRVANGLRYIVKCLSPVDRRPLRRRIVVAAEENQWQREQQKQRAGGKESGDAAAVARKWKERVQEVHEAGAEMDVRRQDTIEERRHEQHADDRPDVSECGAESGKAALLL